MGKCNNCKHGRTAFEEGMNSIDGMTLLKENKDSVLGDMYGVCENGNQDTFVKWWKNSIGVPSSQNTDVDCYEPTEFTKRTDNLKSLLDEMLELVKKNKKKKV